MTLEPSLSMYLTLVSVTSLALTNIFPSLLQFRPALNPNQDPRNMMDRMLMEECAHDFEFRPLLEAEFRWSDFVEIHRELQNTNLLFCWLQSFLVISVSRRNIDG